jgi:hypothetical protein
MYAHKWKRHARETAATVKEIRRKASKIAPAYNKGALQYLPDEKDPLRVATLTPSRIQKKCPKRR